ncbi:MAG: FeoA family protein [Lentisphaeria bacterium]
MPEENSLLKLTECPSRAQYVVVNCSGGASCRRRLHNIGLSEGKTITKVHSHPFRGPVTVRVQNTVLAVGHSMAERIQVKPVPDETPDPDR